MLMLDIKHGSSAFEVSIVCKMSLVLAAFEFLFIFCLSLGSNIHLVPFQKVPLILS